MREVQLCLMYMHAVRQCVQLRLVSAGGRMFSKLVLMTICRNVLVDEVDACMQSGACSSKHSSAR
jgi:hypothetical protein